MRDPDFLTGSLGMLYGSCRGFDPPKAVLCLWIYQGLILGDSNHLVVKATKGTQLDEGILTWKLFAEAQCTTDLRRQSMYR